MLNTQRITTILAVLVAAVASVTLTAADATASAIFAENFNSKTVGTLEGQSADTGQTWGVFNLWNAGVPGMHVTTVVGQHGTKGGGSVNGETARGSQADFTRVTSTPTGRVTIEMDIKIGDSASQPLVNGPQFWVLDTVSGYRISGALDNSNHPGMQANGGWLDGTTTSFSSDLVSGVDTDLHFVGIADLINKKFKWKYNSIQNPSKVTPWVSDTYTNDFYPNRISIFTNLPSNRDQGYDNIRIADSLLPEPATVTLLGIGGLAMLRRRRAA